jgi:tetratricopeptide (TPR) repeat protein
MEGQTPNYESAETLRKNKSYSEASQQFAQLWQQNPSQFIGWRYAFCLRKVGRLEEAEAIAREALEKFPEDKFTKSELGWTLYEKELKPAKEESDLGRIIQVANQILKFNPDGIALTKVAMAVMKVAKGRRNWRVLLEWADRIRPENLDDQPMIFNGKRGMAEREIWYVNRANALLQLERFDEARQFAQAGLADIPNEVFLRRTAALSLARSGNLVSGITEMRSLLTHPRADWYMKAELAELEYLVGNHSEAYRLICDSVSSTRQPVEYKLEYFVTLAQVALALGKLDVAAEHITLARAIRSDQGWKIPPEIVQVEKDILTALRAVDRDWPDLPKDLKQLERVCRKHWQEGATEGIEFYQGMIKPYPEGRHFAYIKRDDGGEDVYVVVRDLPRNCNQPGNRVEFSLKTSYDRKKDRESVQAINIRCIRE